MLYFGEYRLVLDDKGRMRIPNKLKNQLGGEEIPVTICAGTENTLFLMTDKEFREWIGDIADATPYNDFDKQNALRMFSSTVFYPEQDPQGRFVLPQKLKEYARINKRVVFLGTMNRIEIWSEEAYDERFGLNKLNINSAVTALNI
jgi:MraZ protein